jgi:hypothetical protein
LLLIGKFHFLFVYKYGFILFSMEDLTEPELIRTNPLCNRTVCLYGYVRGCPIKSDTPIHIPGKYVRGIFCIEFCFIECLRLWRL